MRLPPFCPQDKWKAFWYDWKRLIKPCFNGAVRHGRAGLDRVSTMYCDSEAYMNSFLEQAREIAEYIRDARRQVHAHAETGFNEHWTTAFIREELQKSGIEIIPWSGETGVVGLLSGARPGPCVALRADIDALPLEEKTGLDYCSQNPETMHGCGHDLHTAALLGAVRLLAARKSELSGQVKFIFQPAEEIMGGAKEMVAAGVLENPEVSFIFGQHNNPGAPTGALGISFGPAMACSASVTISVHGQGGHGAIPNKAKDPVVAAAAIIMALQTIVSREMDPLQAVVITVASIHAGSAGNIIPDHVDMRATVRMFDMELYDSMQYRIERIITSVAEAYQCTAEMTYTKAVPYVYNEPALAERIAQGPLAAVFGKENIIALPPSTGSEDFAFFMERVPGIFTWFGSGGRTYSGDGENSKNSNGGNKNTANGESAGAHAVPLHNPCFNPDEDSLPFAAAAYAQAAWDWLEGKV